MFNFSQMRTRYSEIMNWKTDEDYQVKSDAMISDPPPLLIMWESHLRHLYLEERLWFLSWTCIVTVLAVAGNILTLGVIIIR